MNMNNCNMTATPCTKTAARLAATFKANQSNPRYMSVSDGNEKLQPSEAVKFLIWNLPAKATCPFSTPHCRKYCYAKAAERYDNPRNMRARNLAATRRENFVRNMVFTIAANLARPSYAKAERIVVRIHESGDFYSRAYVRKWLKVARFFEDDPRVVFMAYTKSVEFFKGEAIPSNMVVRFSLWDDTEPEQLEIAQSMGLPIYTAVEQFTDEPEENRCRCEDCGTCGACWDIARALMLCEIH